MAIANELRRRDFTAFKRHLYKRYTHARHLDALDHALMDVAHYVETGGREGTWMLIAEMPPRHGKTLTVSRLFPAWYLGRNPDHRVMLVSYGATLAHKNSRYARTVIRSEKYADVFPQLALNPASAAVDAWDIDEHEGGGDAMGVLGGATGKGAHILIADDLVKNRQEAESEVIRERTWDALIEDLLSRLEPGGAVVLFATRWHQDDPIGRMLKLLQDPKKANGPVKRLRFPAIAEEGDELGRQVGEALWPDRYPLATLEAIRARSGPYSWSALYQQRPTPAEGGIFKRAWFEPPVVTLPEVKHAVRFWDLAMSEKTSADYTVGVKLAQCADGHYYIADVVRQRVDWGNLIDFMAGVILADGPDTIQGIEKKGYMSRAVEDLNIDPRLHGYQVWGYDVHTDKLTRALPVAAKLAAGVVHTAAGHWTRDFVEEICAFPNGAHDDQVDALAGAWHMIDPDNSGLLSDLYMAHDDGFGLGMY